MSRYPRKISTDIARLLCPAAPHCAPRRANRMGERCKIICRCIAGCPRVWRAIENDFELLWDCCALLPRAAPRAEPRAALRAALRAACLAARRVPCRALPHRREMRRSSAIYKGMWRDLVWKDINRYCKIATEIYGDIQRDMERDRKIVRDMETHSYSEPCRAAPHRREMRRYFE